MSLDHKLLNRKAEEECWQVLVAASVWIWGLRLTLNWALSWEGLSHEDWRYVDIRSKLGADSLNEKRTLVQTISYWVFGSFFAIHVVPAGRLQYL